MNETLRTLRWSELSVPAMTSKTRGIVKARLRSLLGNETAGTRLEPGLPPGCTLEMIEEACKETTGQSVSGTRFKHLSSWKPHGAFLVEATTSGGNTMTLVFKRAVATPEFNPVLERLPFTPGPAEYAILQAPGDSLRAFLPRVFFAAELEPGVEYVMLSEDLDASHRRLHRDDRMRLIDQISDLHAALAEQGAVPRTDLLIDSLANRDDLPDFFEYRLRQHYQETGDRIVGRLIRQFDAVANVYRSVDLPEKAIGIVHGDPNLSNIRVPRQPGGPPKFIDWEWAGVHLLHIDLATILKFANPVLESKVLRRYAERNAHLSHDMHRRLYYWCKLERSLLDVCLMATLAENPAPRQLNVDIFLQRSSRAALHAYTHLVGNATNQ
ncbi:MAG: phosphotransferase [Actinomycetota bacterium]